MGSTVMARNSLFDSASGDSAGPDTVLPPLVSRAGVRSVDSHPRYQILEKIGSGSFATVYRGHDRELGRDVAVKQIHAQYLQDPKQLERYWQEAQLLASFQHPNIVTIYDIVRDRGWLILELMQGNLSKISGRKPLDVDSLRSTIAHCLRALKFLHSHGVIHGDIKPGNLMLDRRKRIKVGDFGLARRVSDEDGSLLKGTTKYMAPELMSDDFGAVGPASDLYSLGFAAYELLCGENFEELFPGLNAFGRDRQIAWMMWHSAPDRRLPEIARVLEGVPEDLRKVIQKLSAKPQSERYKTADEALSDLNIDIKLVGGGTGEGEDNAAASKPDSKRRTLLVVAFAASFLMSMAMLFLPSGNSVDPAAGGKDENVARGVLREVRAADGSLVLEDVDGVPTEIKVGDKPRIRLNDEKYVLLKDLLEGDYVEARSAGEGAPTTFFVNRPVDSRGTIQSLAVADKEFVARVITGAAPEEVRVAVGQRSRLSLNGKQVPLVELREGDRIEFRHIRGPEGRLARDLLKLEAFRSRELVGYLVAVDADKRQLSLERRNHPQGPLVVEYAADCKVSINGRPFGNSRALAPSDLRESDRLTLELDVAASTISAVRGTRISGTIQEIREAGRAFAIKLDKPLADGAATVVAGVPEGTAVTLGQGSAAGDDLRRFDRVDAILEGDEPATGGDSSRTALAVDATRPVRQDRLALLFANQIYDDKRLSRLATPLESSKRLHAALVGRFGVSPERARIVADAGKQAWLEAFDEALSKTSNLTQLTVSISGHVYVDEKGAWIAPRDAKWDNLAESCVSLAEVCSRMDQCAARERILLLDGSRGGDGADLARQPSTEEMVERIRRSGGVPMMKLAILASCAKGETGRLSRDETADAFAEALAAGYSGRADANRDLEIEPRELFDYVSRELPEFLAAGSRQTPVLFAP